MNVALPRWPWKMRLLFCVFLSMHMTMWNHAQEVTPVFRHLDYEHGLSNYYVAGVAQDEQGFLWFSTDHGLNRYDGRAFVHYYYEASDTSGISGNNLRAIDIAENGQMWLMTNNGVDRFDPRTERFTHFEFEETIRSIVNDGNDGLWVGADVGLFHLNSESKLFSPVTLSAHPWGDRVSKIEIQKVVLGHDQSIYVATNVGLYQKAPKEDFGSWILPCLEDTQAARTEFMIRDVAMATDDNRIWVASIHGLFELDTVRNCLTAHPINDRLPDDHRAIRVISLAENGTLWWGDKDDKGIYSMDIANGNLSYLSHVLDEKIAGSNLTEICIDDTGIVWLSTSANGVHIYDPGTRHFQWHGQGQVKDDKSSSFIRANSVMKDSKGVQWITTDGGLIWKDSLGALTYPKLKNVLPQLKYGFYRVKETSEGIFWSGTVGGGILRLDAETGTVRHYFKTPDLLGGEEQNNIVTAFCLDQHNNVWLGFWGGGLAVIEENKLDEPRLIPCDKQDSTSLGACFVKTIHESKDGSLWIAEAKGGGLIHYDPSTGDFKRYLPDPTNENSLNHDYVRTIVEDENGDLFLGTSGGGLSHFIPQTETFTNYTKQDGLPNDFVTAMAKDDNGDLWISTVNALSKFNPATGHFQNFDDQNGLPKTQLHGFTGPDPVTHHMTLGTDKGYVVFHPDSIEIDSFPPKTCIVKMERYLRDDKSGEPIVEKGISYKEEINLGYNDYIVTFEVAAITNRKADKAQIAYKLQGFQDEWIQLGNKRQISFTSLPAKQYTLLVKSANADGIWDASPAALRINVSPPWWKTNVARLCYGLLLLGIGLYFRRAHLNRLKLKNELALESLQTEKLKELDEIKTRFFSNVSHEFRTPLTVILSPMDDLIKSIKDSKNVQTLKMVKANANRLLDLVNQLMDLSKIQDNKVRLNFVKQPLGHFIDHLCQTFLPIAEKKEINFLLENRLGERLITFDRKAIETILTNLLSNAFKFTSNQGEIIVKADVVDEQEEPFVQIIVKDNGVGIATEQAAHIFDRFYQVDESGRQSVGTGIGLSLVKELVELHQGDIRLESELGSGSTFVVSLPTHLPVSEVNATSYQGQPSTEVVLDLHDTSSGPELSETSGTTSKKEDAPIILIVDDNQDIRQLIAATLGEQYAVVLAVDGNEGLTRALEIVPDLVVSDIMMPGMDGYELCDRLKNNAITSHIPVILLTAKASHHSKMDGLKLGADVYLTKPFDTDELRIRVDNLISSRQALKTKYAECKTWESVWQDLPSQDQLFVEKLNAYLDEHMRHAQLSIDDIAKAMTIGERQLRRKMKALTQQTPNQYLRTYRLRQAAQLLVTEHCDVAQVAFEVGFNSPAYFTKCFKEEYGQTPGEFKDDHIGRQAG